MDVNSGVSNHHKMMVLEEGMEFQPMSSTAGDAQLIESRRFAIEEVCRIFRVPPP